MQDAGAGRRYKGGTQGARRRAQGAGAGAGADADSNTGKHCTSSDSVMIFQLRAKFENDVKQRQELRLAFPDLYGKYRKFSSFSGSRTKDAQLLIQNSFRPVVCFKRNIFQALYWVEIERKSNLNVIA